jgi:hypothetical protein
MPKPVRVLALAVALLVISDCRQRVSIAPPAANITIPRVAHCLSVDGLPDPTCTPGTIDLRVTQANIKTTICVSGYTATVRPPVSYTNTLKVRQIGEYGFSDPNLRNYEEDHLIPLELGGNPTDPQNLWPEPGHTPNPKDAIEGKLHSLVCKGKMPLAEAQNKIRTNWKTALQ